MRGHPRDEYKSDEKDIGDREAFEWSAKTEARGQANWYKGPKSYWTERFAKDDDGVSVAEEDRDPASLLNHYRRLLKIRATHPALRSGAQRVISRPGELLAVERTAGGQRLLVVANLSPDAHDYRTSGRDLLSGSRIQGRLHLAPYQSTIVER